MRNLGGLLLLIGVLGFFYAGAQKDKRDPLPPGLTAFEALQYPVGRWEVAQYASATAAALGCLMLVFPKGR